MEEDRFILSLRFNEMQKYVMMSSVDLYAQILHGNLTHIPMAIGREMPFYTYHALLSLRDAIGPENFILPDGTKQKSAILHNDTDGSIAKHQRWLIESSNRCNDLHFMLENNTTNQMVIKEWDAHTLQTALETFARVSCGQINTIYWLSGAYNIDHYRKEYAEMFVKSTLFPELDWNSSYGIGSWEKLGDCPDIAWDLYQVIRYTTSWFLYPEGGMTVNFDKPLHVCFKHPLMKAEIEKYPR
jgi:hypothetical protein